MSVQNEQSKPIQKMSTADSKLYENRKKINEGRLTVVNEYMKFYSDVI